MRGEDQGFHVKRTPLRGSPPHARGRRIVPQRHELTLGITPACAGKTGGRLGLYPFRRDHPRMRGEDADGVVESSRAGGSPPHARGRRWRYPIGASRMRITPACAGKTRPPCGIGVDVLGSPPHARGRRARDRVWASRLGITPACAGKTPRTLRRRRASKDHPRMRGEDTGRSEDLGPSIGSPPHARGRRRADNG